MNEKEMLSEEAVRLLFSHIPLKKQPFKWENFALFLVFLLCALAGLTLIFMPVITGNVVSGNVVGASFVLWALIIIVLLVLFLMLRARLFKIG